MKCNCRGFRVFLSDAHIRCRQLELSCEAVRDKFTTRLSHTLLRSLLSEVNSAGTCKSTTSALQSHTYNIRHTNKHKTNLAEEPSINLITGHTQTNIIHPPWGLVRQSQIPRQRLCHRALRNPPQRHQCQPPVSTEQNGQFILIPEQLYVCGSKQQHK